MSASLLGLQPASTKTCCGHLMSYLVRPCLSAHPANPPLFHSQLLLHVQLQGLLQVQLPGLHYPCWNFQCSMRCLQQVVDFRLCGSAS